MPVWIWGSCFTSLYIFFLFLRQIAEYPDVGVRGLGHHTYFPGLGKGRLGIVTCSGDLLASLCAADFSVYWTRSQV